MDLVVVEDVSKHFVKKKGRFIVKACDDINLSIPAGKTFGLVGESGCGKTTLGRIVMALLKPDRGRVFFEGTEISSLKEREIRPKRRNFQMIFQDSRSAFNPRMRVYDALKEAVNLHIGLKGREAREFIGESISRVNLHKGLLYNFIGNLSGGEVKRLDILRAIMISPRFIVADEPLSPLDISIQSQIVNLFMEVQQKDGISMLFISHDLRLVRLLSHRVAVMYGGRIVEVAGKSVIGDNPLHPYTKFLWNPRDGQMYVRLPDTGCVYKGSCELYQKKGFPSVCMEEVPPLREIEKGHFVACHFVK